MSNKIVLDASAFLALAQEEKGAEIIKPLLKFENLPKTTQKLKYLIPPIAPYRPFIRACT